MFLDTGAEVSLIPASIFHEELEPVLGSLKELPSPITVVGVADTGVPGEGHIANAEIDGLTVEIGFLVVGSRHTLSGCKKDHPILLACNALKVIAGLRGTGQNGGSLGLVLDSLRYPELIGLVCEAKVETSTKGEVWGRIHEPCKGNHDEESTDTEKENPATYHQLLDGTQVELPVGVVLLPLSANDVEQVALLLREHQDALPSGEFNRPLVL